MNTRAPMSAAAKQPLDRGIPASRAVSATRTIVAVRRVCATRAVGVLGTVLALGACATPRSTPVATAGPAPVEKIGCSAGTGSRLPPGDGRCGEAQRSYSSEDIRRTGSVDAGDALQLLDPSITVHH